MEYQKIMEYAAHGLALPKDMLCFEALCRLKYEYEATGLDAEKVRLRKQQIRRAHAQYTEAYRGYLAGMQGYQENIRRSEMLQSQIVKEKDPAKKLALALECIGAMTGDGSFVRHAS